MLPVSHCILVQPADLSVGQFLLLSCGFEVEGLRILPSEWRHLERGSNQMCGADRETEGAHTAVTATRIGCGRKLAKPG